MEVQRETVKSNENYFKDFQNASIEAMAKLDLDIIGIVAKELHAAKERGNTIYFFGNGGSLSIASHMACDFGKGTKPFKNNNFKPYKVVSLDNEAWFSAQANDGADYFLNKEFPGTYTHGYDGVFVGQLENFLLPGDILFGISSSGNSQNIINAFLYGKERGAKNIAMIGFDGGRCLELADHSILVESKKGEYGLVEGVHSVVHHMLYEFAKRYEN